MFKPPLSLATPPEFLYRLSCLLYLWLHPLIFLLPQRNHLILELLYTRLCLLYLWSSLFTHLYIPKSSFICGHASFANDRTSFTCGHPSIFSDCAFFTFGHTSFTHDQIFFICGHAFFGYEYKSSFTHEKNVLSVATPHLLLTTALCVGPPSLARTVPHLPVATPPLPMTRASLPVAMPPFP